MAERPKSGSRSSSSDEPESPEKPENGDGAARKDDDADKPMRGTAPSAADIDKLEKFEPSEEAKRKEPSDVDAMGDDKRRQVVGHSYGPSARRQIMFFVAVAAVLVVVVGGWLALVAAFDKAPSKVEDKAPWSKPAATPALAAEQNAKPTSPADPCGEPGNEYPIPSQSPCAPPSKSNGFQGDSSGK